ncbi:MAG: hypothetical protein Tsb0021_17250 [Chlamydiales bacterium]
MNSVHSFFNVCSSCFTHGIEKAKHFVVKNFLTSLFLKTVFPWTNQQNSRDMNVSQTVNLTDDTTTRCDELGTIILQVSNQEETINKLIKELNHQYQSSVGEELGLTIENMNDQEIFSQVSSKALNAVGYSDYRKNDILNRIKELETEDAIIVLADHLESGREFKEWFQKSFRLDSNEAQVLLKHFEEYKEYLSLVSKISWTFNLRKLDVKRILNHLKSKENKPNTITLKDEEWTQLVQMISNYKNLNGCLDPKESIEFDFENFTYHFEYLDEREIELGDDPNKLPLGVLNIRREKHSNPEGEYGNDVKAGSFKRCDLALNFNMKTQDAFLVYYRDDLEPEDTEKQKQEEVASYRKLKGLVPHIAGIEYFKKKNLLPYMVMKYVPHDGHDFFLDKVPDRGNAPLRRNEEIKLIGSQLGEILVSGKRNSIIYADLKPENFLMVYEKSPSGKKLKEILMIDFESILFCQDGYPEEEIEKGTTCYMAPEILKTKSELGTIRLDHSQDVYSAGVTLLEWRYKWEFMSDRGFDNLLNSEGIDEDEYAKNYVLYFEKMYEQVDTLDKVKARVMLLSSKSENELDALDLFLCNKILHPDPIQRATPEEFFDFFSKSVEEIYKIS